MSSETYKLWAAGRCPCCSTELPGWTDDPPAAIGEGVMMCGRCIANDHHLEPKVVDALLLAIASRDDAPLGAILGA